MESVADQLASQVSIATVSAGKRKSFVPWNALWSDWPSRAAKLGALGLAAAAIGSNFGLIRGEWLYLYRAIDKSGATVEFYFSKNRDLAAAKRFMRKALARHGRPAQITIDGSQTNRTAILETDVEARLKLSETDPAGESITIRNSKYMNNRIEQDHRRIKRRVGPMLGFKSTSCADIILSGVELVHMIRKGQLEPIDRRTLTLARQFESLAA